MRFLRKTHMRLWLRHALTFVSRFACGQFFALVQGSTAYVMLGPLARMTWTFICIVSERCLVARRGVLYFMKSGCALFLQADVLMLVSSFFVLANNFETNMVYLSYRAEPLLGCNYRRRHCTHFQATFELHVKRRQ